MAEQTGRPVSDSATSAGVDADAAKHQWVKDVLAEGIDNRLKNLEPAPEPGHPLWTTLVSIIGVGVVIGFLFLGIASAPKLPAIVSLRVGGQTNLPPSLVDGGQKYVLFSNDATDSRSVQAYDLQSKQVLDLSRGRAGIRQASLSNDEATVALAIAEPGGTALYVTDMAGSDSRIFDSSALTRSGTSSLGWTSVSICPWSELLWSLTDKRIAFYVCSEDSSALFVADTRANANPLYQIGTKSNTTAPRNAIWTATDKLITSGGDKDLDSVIEVDPTQSKYEIIYGPQS
jgi:Tol biopolymer transport system component